MTEKKDSPGCSILLALAGLAGMLYLAYVIVRFFQRPDAIETIIECLTTLGLCAGMAVLALGGLYLYVLVSARQPSTKLSQRSRDYPVHCYPAELKKTTTSPVPETVPNSSGRKSVYPVYLLLSITNYGISLAALPAQNAWDWVAADNASR